MKTDVDSCLKDIADWFVKNRRGIKPADLQPILQKHCESVEEGEKLIKFLETGPGQLRFKTLLRERKEEKPSTLWSREVTKSPLWQKLSFEEKYTLTRNIPGNQTDLGTYDEYGHIFSVGYVTLEDGQSYELLINRDPDWENWEWVEDLSITEAQKAIKTYEEKRKRDEEWQREHGKPSYLKETETKPCPKCGKPLRLRYFSKTKEYSWGHEYSISDIMSNKSICDYSEKAVEKPSYLKEAVAETECQIISPQYYDILTWLNVPVPDYSFSIESEVKERKIDEVLEKLKDGVARIHDSAVFREFLTTMSKFWVYSIGNQILIMIQRRDATRVAGFNTWKDLGRYVKAGERGIAILAPCLPPKELKRWILWDVQMQSSLGVFNSPEEAEEYADKHLVKDWRKNVEIRKEEAVAPVPTYFKVVYVFDVSQTEGKALPEFVVPVLSGAYSEELYNKLMKLATKHSLTVTFEPRPDLPSEIKGMLLGKEIWVKGDEPEAQRLKTLAHEEAHYFSESVFFIPRAEAEVIAESVAFVVGTHFGFDSGIRSFPYVAIWAKEKKVLEQNLASIRKISGRMIEELG